MKSVDSSKSRWVRWPLIVPLAHGFGIVSDACRNSKSMWLAPLFTMRSPPKKTSLADAVLCEIA